MAETDASNAVSTPEDVGTGLGTETDADWNSAGQFGAIGDTHNGVGFVEVGMNFTLDSTTPALTVSAGRARLLDTSTVDVQDNAGNYTQSIEHGVAFVVEVDETTGVSLTDGAVNHVYIAKDPSTNNRVYFEVNTTDTAPSDPSIKIGTADTSADTVDDTINRAPDGDFDQLDVETLSVTNDGDGSNIDADTVDGLEASEIGGEPMYGGGSDGTITRSSGGTEDGVIAATDYTLEAGNVRTVDSGFLMIKATSSITINGDLDASGAGATGGGGGSSGGSASGGSSGSPSDVIPAGPGGSGGNGPDQAGNGGDGGDGDTGDPPKRDSLFQAVGEATAMDIGVNSLDVGSGGGGGGGAATGSNYSNTNGGNGSSPGGGGGGSVHDTGTLGGPSGGNGGDGGGFVFLMAPEVTVGGTINVGGTDGSDGGVTDDGNGGSGGGGGGSGGVVFITARDLTENSPTYTVAGGAGGTGASGSTVSGGDGASGADGTVYKQLA